MDPFNWHDIFSNFSVVMNTIYAVTVVVILLLIITENRSPIKSISWILVVALIPVFGVVFYLFFGQKYRKNIIISLRVARFQKRVKTLSEKQLRQLKNIKPGEVDPVLAEKRDLMSLLLRNDNAFLSRNTNVQILKNGTETFQSVKKAIQQAKHHIHLEFYIIQFDQIGTEIFDLLKEKASQGVEVRVIYDSVGSYPLSRKKRFAMRKAGIQLKSFQKVVVPLLSSKVNYRNHRKIIVIDGKIGFTGGLNIADRYIENKEKYWRDTFVRIEGKSVSALQSIFMNDWFYVSKQNIYHEKYFCETEAENGNLTQIISSGPDSDWHAISQFYFSVITSSKKSVFIATPYFIPNDEISFALKAAALRGIDVRILIPKKADSMISHWSGQSYFGEMLKAGVKIYRYTKGFIHSKLVMSDEIVCSIGTANLDYRSLETNFEVCAVFYDKNICQQLTKQYINDIENAELIVYPKWKNRPRYKKLIVSFARLFAPLM